MHQYWFNMNTDKFMVDGKYFNMRGTCVIPIFRHYREMYDHTDKYKNTIYMGSHAMSEEIIVLDNSPYVKNGSDYAQIGFTRNR